MRINSYKEYGLDCLIGNEYPKVNLYNPLLFALAIADTIDPVKIFNKESDFIDIQRVLESVNMNVFNNSVDLQVSDIFFDFNRYYKVIKSLQNWVEVSVDVEPQNRVIHIYW